MKILLVLLVSLGLGSARPSNLLGLPTLAYTNLVSGGAPVGADGRVIDTPEVTIAKVQHAAAQLNERASHANAAARSGGDVSRLLVSQTGNQQLATILAAQNLAGLQLANTPLTLASLLNDANDDESSAPVGSDGRVVDTPAVTRAKVEHATAHLNEKLNHANEAVRNSGLFAISAPPAVALNL